MSYKPKGTLNQKFRQLALRQIWTVWVCEALEDCHHKGILNLQAFSPETPAVSHREGQGNLEKAPHHGAAGWGKRKTAATGNSTQTHLPYPSQPQKQNKNKKQTKQKP